MLTYVKRLGIFIFLAIFFVSIPMVSAQDSETNTDEPSDAEMIAFFKTQPPIKDSEMPAVIEIMLKIQEDPASAEANIESFVEKNKLEMDRLLYVISKVSSGMLIAMDSSLRPFALEMVQYEELLPTDQELEIIKKYLPELTKNMVP
jgi:hypothetical protein